MSETLRMDEQGWYHFYFNSKPDEYGEIYNYKIYFQYRTGESIFNSVKMLNDCDEDILYFDAENCKVSKIISVPTKHTIIGVKGSIEFLNKVIQKLKENGKDITAVWKFNEKHYDTSFEELLKLTNESNKINEKYNNLFINDLKTNDKISLAKAFKEFIN